MKILKKILIFIVVVVVLVLAVDVFLPGKVTVSRSRVMPISRATAFEKVAVLQNWKKWMTWAKLDTSAVYEYSADPAEGLGAWYSWKGNKDMGSGKMTIITMYDMDSLNMIVEFEDKGQGEVAFRFFDKENGKTEVNWSMSMELSFPLRFMGLFMDGLMAKDFEEGLEGIEKLGLEEPAKEMLKCTIGTSKEMMVLTMTDSASVQEIGAKYGIMYAKIQKEMAEQHVEQAGPVFAINERFDMDKGFAVFTAGIPVSAEVLKVKNPQIRYTKMEPQNAVMYDYYGDPSKIQPAYEGMFEYITKKGLQPRGHSWEEYITDPEKEPDTTKWLTRIYIPVN